MALLEVDNLKTWFHTRNGIVRAVDGVSYTLEAGETVGIVGESGSGKSVLHYSMLGLIPQPPGRIEGGRILFDGMDLVAIPTKSLRGVRGKRISMIFQDPMTALNPYMKVGAQLMEPLRIHDGVDKKTARKEAIAALEAVGIQDAEKRLSMYPHEFSGGMRQRVMIAMALITRPEILIADEPTTALDVTVQAQILELIKQRQKDLGMAVVLITHDLGVVAGMCDRVLVMYAGHLVEGAPTRQIFKGCKHPYTHALMEAMPATQQTSDTLYTIPGMPPDLSQPITGCAFAPRCDHVEEACKSTAIGLEHVGDGHQSRCRRVGDLPW